MRARHTGEALGVVSITGPPIVHDHSASVHGRRASVHVNVGETLHLLAEEMRSRSLTCNQYLTTFAFKQDY